MHHADNILFPSDSTPYDTFMYEDMLNDFRKNLEERGFKLCPEGLTVNELSLTESSQQITDFINKYYGTEQLKVQISFTELQSMIERGNAIPIGFFWNNLLVGLVIAETYDVFYKGTVYKAGCGDYLTLHPKFRNKGMAATLVAKTMDKLGEMESKFIFFHTHAKLHVKTPFTHTLYNLSLTEIPRIANISNKSACKLRPVTTTLIAPTIDHVKLLNNQPYSIYIKHDDKMLQTMLKYDLIYTDGISVLRFISFCNIQKGIQIKTAILIDYVKPNRISFFNSALNALREKGFDLVTIINDKTMNDVLSAFPFEKNSEMYTYTANILPKAKINEIHLNLR